MLLLATSALATTRVVEADGSGTFTSIQEAIDRCVDGDVILVGPGTYAEVVDTQGRNIELRSSDGAASTTLLGSLNIPAGEVSVEGFTVQNPGARGITVQDGTVTFTEMVLEDLGDPTAVGGAVFIESGTVAFSASTFARNVATYGGAIELTTGALTLIDTTFSDNAAGFHGGAIHAESGADIQVHGGTFTGNTQSSDTAYGAGGAIHTGKDGAFYAQGVSFTANGTPDYGTHVAWGGALMVDDATVATLSGCTFDSNLAYYGAAIFLDRSSVIVDTTTFVSNYAIYGAASYIQSSVEARYTDSVFDRNSTYYYGAALYISGLQALETTRSTFSENLAYYGYGGAFMAYYVTDLEVTDTTFTENVAYYSGGAVYLYGMERAVWRGVTAEGNSSTYGSGGVIYGAGAVELAIAESSFDGNEAYYGGGAVYNVGGLLVFKSTFTGNEAQLQSGGAVFVAATGPVGVYRSQFEDNVAGGDAGGLGLEGGSLELDRSTFIANEAGGVGGGLYAGDTTSRTGRNLTFVANRAAYGGGLYIAGGAEPDDWSNLVIEANEAGSGGGAVVVQTSQSTFVNNVVLGNAASDQGAGVYLYEAGYDLRNTVFAWSSGAEAVYAEASTGTATYDDWFENGAGDTVGLTATDSLAEDPRFVDYSDNGDPEDDSFVLWRSSALIDAGDPFVLDEDGSPSDIGLNSGPWIPLEDGDGDGVSSAWDCDDTNPGVYPGAAEVWYDGTDADCGGDSDWDQDNDGVDTMENGGEDCDDLAYDVVACDTGDAGDDTAVDVFEGDPEPEPVATGCACDSSAAPTGGVGAALVWLVLRRRVSAARRDRTTAPSSSAPRRSRRG